MLRNLHADSLDLILVEGFKFEPIPKIEIHRPRLGQPLMAPDDPCIIAVATDDPDFVAIDRPLLDLNRAGACGGFHPPMVSRVLKPLGRRHPVNRNRQ